MHGTVQWIEITYDNQFFNKKRVKIRPLLKTTHLPDSKNDLDFILHKSFTEL